MILLDNGMIIDGSGVPSRLQSLLVDNGKIVEVGVINPTSQMKVFDCKNYVVAPGFIDVHSHSDLEVLEHHSEKIRQGITTEVVGNCGFSLYPRLPDGPLVPSFNLFERRGSRKWDDANSYFESVRNDGVYTNVASLIGHASLRANVSGMRAGALLPEEMRKATECLSSCLEQGAIGLSTGLNEVPSSYADFEELKQLCHIIKSHDAFYTSHLRDYKFKIRESVQEALNLGRKTGVSVQLSHLQTVGRKNWDKMDEVLALVDRAADEGVDVGIDAYPYLAGSCHLTQCLPTWALEGGTDNLLDRLNKPEVRRRIEQETEEGLANSWADIVVSSVPNATNQRLVGLTVQDIAKEWGCSGVDAALELLLTNQGNVRIVSFNQSDPNLQKVLSHPRTSVITDGFVTEGKSHPRTFGTYPTLIGEFVRKRKWFSLEEAIYKATGLPASRFRLPQRGLIRKGYWADLAVFNPETIGTNASYLDPDLPPQGIVHVMVNGSWVIVNGEIQKSYPGQTLLCKH